MEFKNSLLEISHTSNKKLNDSPTKCTDLPCMSNGIEVEPLIYLYRPL